MAYVHDRKSLSDDWWQIKPLNSGWHKDLKPAERRKKMLKAHGYDRLATARALNQLGNVSRDASTRRAARADAKYFFKENEKQGRSMKFVD
jgi:hypothetical protein